MAVGIIFPRAVVQILRDRLMRSKLFQPALEILVKACEEHTLGTLTTDPTMGTCWDADRLDLWRVGIYPRAEYMCTEEAKKKEIIEWAVSHTAIT